ncbi:shikimate kinase [Microcoleus sp. FACHB-68]|uniref:shikimate kinase n=1 Tax=Microcoleus sp. FACHB-68 TaxID=2692826 RepID=UPI0032206A08
MSDLLKGVNLYLVGMMGAGKTTVGRILAKQLGYRFVDTDELVEQVAGQSIAEMFETEGEEAFRQTETKVLGEVAAYKKLVISTGGGIVLRQQNWSYLHYGIVVWLDVPVEQLYERLRQDTTRPLLRDPDPLAKLHSLYESRQRLYAQADVHIITGAGETPQQLAPRVLEEIRKVLKSEVASAAESN